MWSFQVALFHLVKCIEVSSMSFQGLTAHFFLMLSHSPLSGYLSSHCLLICSPTEGHLGCFEDLAVRNKAGIDIKCRFLCGHKFLATLDEYQGT